jgi:hypothetical protein
VFRRGAVQTGVGVVAGETDEPVKAATKEAA